MATCSGGHCTGYCYSNVCSYTAPWPIIDTVFDTEGYCGTHSVTYGYWEVNSGQEANATLLELNEHINSMRGSIDQERTRRGLAQRWAGAVIGDGTLIDNALLEDLKTGLNQISNVAYQTYPAGSTVLAGHIDYLRVRIENLRRECLCNGNCGAHLTCVCYNDCGCFYA